MESQGMAVLRFAHRHSVQPLAGDQDSLEVAKTHYLAESPKSDLWLALVRQLIRSPKNVFLACRSRRALGVHDFALWHT